MAIFHLTANIISRGRGQSAVAAAAYRLGAALRDERYGLLHNYRGKRGVRHSEIMAPDGAPAWVSDREQLWNKVEASEMRKDSQLARVIEVGLPVELSADERLALLRDYVATEFVAKGMVADFCVRGDPHNPHAHILLTLRGLTATGFGPKERRWNGKSVLLEWRAAWASRANDHLARAGHAVRIDHRTLEAQQIELEPARRIGVARRRADSAALPEYLKDRAARQQEIAGQNGSTILEDPTVALRALTLERPTFTRDELVRFLASRTHGSAQFDAVLAAVLGSNDLVAQGAGGDDRFTSRDMIEAAASLMRRTASMLARRGHGVAPDRQNLICAEFALSGAARRAFEYLVGDGDAKALAVTDDVKAAALRAAYRAWNDAGLTVTVAAPTRRAADALHALLGVPSHSLAECEAEWRQGGLTREAVLLLDGGETLGLQQLERVLAVADRARAKAVLIADVVQLGARRVDLPIRDIMRLAAPGAAS